MIQFTLPYLPEFSDPAENVPGLTNLIGTYLHDYDLSKLCDYKFLVILCRDFYLPNLSVCVPKILSAIISNIPELKVSCIISHAVLDSTPIIDVSICHFSELQGVNVEYV